MNGLRKPTNLMRTRRAVFLCPDYSMQPSEIPSESARVKMSGARFPGRGDEGGLVPRYFPAEARRRIVRNGRGNRKKILRGRKTKRSCCINSRKRRNATARLLFRADSRTFSPLYQRSRFSKLNPKVPKRGTPSVSWVFRGRRVRAPRESRDLGSGRCSSSQSELQHPHHLLKKVDENFWDYLRQAHESFYPNCDRPFSPSDEIRL